MPSRAPGEGVYEGLEEATPVAVGLFTPEGRPLGDHVCCSVFARSGPLIKALADQVPRAAAGEVVTLPANQYPGLSSAVSATLFPVLAASGRLECVAAVVKLSGPVGPDLAAEGAALLGDLACAGIGVSRLDAEGRYRYVNEPFAALNRRSPEEHLGRLATEVNPWLACAFQGLRERLPSREGPRWVEVPAPPIPEDGRPEDLHVMLLPGGCGEDASGTWLLVREGRDGMVAASFRASMLGAKVAIYDLDLVRWRLLRDVGIEALFGLPIPAVRHDRIWWLDHIHPDDRPRVEARFDAWRKGEPTPTRLEYRLRRGDGSWAYVVDQAELVRDETGRPARAMASLRDVTSEYEAHRALRRSETRYRLATLATRDLVYDWDLESDRIEWSSLAHLGYDEESDCCDSLEWWEAQIHPDDRARVVDALRAAVARGDRFWRDTYRFRRKDGTYAEISDRGYLDRDCSGQFTRMVGAMQDVTEQRSAEAEVRRINAELERRVQERTAELVAANKELEAFSYSVSHDLRAPLRAIDGFTSALQARLEKGLDPESRDWLLRVRGAATRMSTLIDDLLQLGRVTRATLQREPVDLRPLFEEVAAELKRRDPKRNVTFILGTLPMALGDAHLLRLVVQNLLENAWKYTRVREHAHIEVGATVQGEEVRVFVRDDGVGFDPARSAQLWEPFQRLHDPQVYEGSGVGLATVERVVARHGGRVGAESTPGRGATFWFTLPRL